MDLSFKDKMFINVTSKVCPKLVQAMKEYYRDEIYTQIKNELENKDSRIKTYHNDNSILANQNQELKLKLDIKESKQGLEPQRQVEKQKEKENDYSNYFD